MTIYKMLRLFLYFYCFLSNQLLSRLLRCPLDHLLDHLLVYQHLPRLWPLQGVFLGHQE